jgi:hypothetical protein
MHWPKGFAFSVKNDFWINTSKYVNLKDMKWEATFPIVFAIAEDNYTGAEEIAFAWISNDYYLNKLGAALYVEPFLADWEKFADQAIFINDKARANHV